MVSGCVGFVGFFALTFGSSWPSTARLVRRVSSSFQVRRTSLVTNADDLTALDDPKGVENLRHEGTQLPHAVRAGHRYHDGNAAHAQVPLKREVPINVKSASKCSATISFRSSPLRLDDQAR